MEAYYFQQLNKEQQHIYHAILKGVQNLENEFLVPACDREMLYNLFFRMRLDHPEIFWVTGFRYKYYQNSPTCVPLVLWVTREPMITQWHCAQSIPSISWPQSPLRFHSQFFRLLWAESSMRSEASIEYFMISPANHLERLSLNRPVIPKKLEFTGFFGTFFVLLTAYWPQVATNDILDK